MAKVFGYDETKFKQGQRLAGILLVEYEFANKDERRTKQDIADEVGVARKTLHQWDTKDANFIAYKNALASDYLNSHLAFVYRKLLEGIDKGSMKGMEIFLKRIGDLDSKSEVTINNGSGSDQSFDERKAALLERLGEQDGVEIVVADDDKGDTAQPKRHNGV